MIPTRDMKGTFVSNIGGETTHEERSKKKKKKGLVYLPKFGRYFTICSSNQSHQNKQAKRF